MVPSEFLLLVDSYNEKEEAKFENYQHLLAWHASNVMNVHLKQKVSVDKLLGKNIKKKKQALTKEERKEQLEKLKKRFGY